MKERIFTWMAMPALKQFAFVLIVFLLSPVFFARAQDNALLYKEIQLSRKSYTFDELTHTIQKQAGITFTYNASQISGKRHFRIKDERMTVIKLLAFIKKKSGIGYRMVSAGMIIYTPPPAKRSAHRRKRKKVVKKKAAPSAQKLLKKNRSTTKPATSETVAAALEKPTGTAMASTDSAPPQTVVVIGDSATAASYYLSAVGSAGGGGMGNIQMVMRYPADNENIINPYASLNPPGSKISWSKATMNQPDIAGFIKKNMVLGAAISMDETYYLSPGLYFGFRFLFVHLAYGIGAYPQWRYGLGAQARLNEKWSMRVEFNTGKRFSEAYSYPTFDTIILPPPDSITPAPPPVITENDIPLRVQSRLTRLSFVLNRQLTKVISVSGGITLNRLKSRYYSNGNPFDIHSIEPPINDAEDRFRTIKPPYILSNSYQPAAATDIKLWIGLKISLFFNLSPQ